MHAGSLESKERSVRVARGDSREQLYFLEWPKHIVFNYKVLTIHGKGEQRILKRHDPKTPQSVERKRLTWFLKLPTKNSFLRFNYNENVGKQSQKFSTEM